MYCHWMVFNMGIPTAGSVRFSMQCQCLSLTASLTVPDISQMTRHVNGRSFGGLTQEPPNRAHRGCICIGKYDCIYYKI